MIKRKQILLWVVALAYNITAFATTKIPEENQQPQSFVVHNKTGFFAVEGSFSVNGELLTTNTLPLANNFCTTKTTLETTLPESFKIVVKIKTFANKQNNKLVANKATENEKPIAQKTVITCPFGTTPNNGNIFTALDNGIAIIPSVKSKKFTSKYFIKTSPLTPLQRRGERYPMWFAM